MGKQIKAKIFDIRSDSKTHYIGDLVFYILDTKTDNINVAGIYKNLPIKPNKKAESVEYYVKINGFKFYFKK